MIGSSWWYWLIATDAGLLVRIALGAGVFTLLAIWEYRRKGPLARRWREYLFLLAAVMAAVVYGGVIDQITVTISWEYFYYGKELWTTLGEGIPPNMAMLRWEAAKVGAKAAWTAGLIIGVVFLLANNPRRGREQLPYRHLYRLMAYPLVSAIACGAILGLTGRFGFFSPWFADLVGHDLWRPERFMCTWGAHLGQYVGGLIGTILAAWQIARRRRTVPPADGHHP